RPIGVSCGRDSPGRDTTNGTKGLRYAERVCTLVHVNGREYRMPQRPTVVVCLDGSSSEYVDAAVDGHAEAFVASLVRAGRVPNVDAAMPTLTNPNNVSIVTGVPPS